MRVLSPDLVLEMEKMSVSFIKNYIEIEKMRVRERKI